MHSFDSLNLHFVTSIPIVKFCLLSSQEVFLLQVESYGHAPFDQFLDAWTFHWACFFTILTVIPTGYLFYHAPDVKQASELANLGHFCFIIFDRLSDARTGHKEKPSWCLESEKPMASYPFLGI